MLHDIMAAIYRSEPVLQKSGGQSPDCRRSAGAGATSPFLQNGRHASTCRDSAHYRRQADLSFLNGTGLHLLKVSQWFGIQAFRDLRETKERNDPGDVLAKGLPSREGLTTERE